MKKQQLRKRANVPLFECVLLGLTLAWAVACTPDIDQDPVPQFATMEFDSQTGRIPQPTSLVINPLTGLIDMGLVGIDVPVDCQSIPGAAMPQAECEFLQYLESLDGFPTVGAATAPSSSPLDMATVTLAPAAATLIVANGQGQALTPDTASVTFDAATNNLRIEPLSGWDIGSNYVVAVRGYDNGIQAQGGLRMIASLTYFMLKQEESLTCGAAQPAELDETCQYFALLAGEFPESPELAKESLFQLELIRQEYGAAGVWGLVDLFGWAKDEVAIIWPFGTHSNPVVELNPQLGMLPVVEPENNIVALPVKGEIDPATLTAHSASNTSGSVLLLNLTQLDAGDLENGFPPFVPSFDGSRIVLTPDSPLIDGDFYGILLRNTITDIGGKPLVPSPLTVLLRSRGPLLNEDGVTTTVSSITDAEAQEAEPGRLILAQLLDDPLFAMFSDALEREEIAYVYAFVYPDPAQTE